jgi:hypothetical protein
MAAWNEAIKKQALMILNSGDYASLDSATK